MPPGQTISRPNLRPDPKEAQLVAAWDFGDPVTPPGLTARCMDLGPTGTFNGVLYGGPCIEQTPLGFGMNLDGVDDYLNVYDGRISDATQGSMGFWVKIRTLTDGTVVCGYGGAAAVNPGGMYLFITLVGGNYYFAVEQRSDGVAIFSVVRGSTVLRVGVWYYVELVSDGSAWQLYVNGATETMTPTSGVNSGNWFGDTVVAAPSRTRVGAARFNGADGFYFPGTIIAGTISNAVRPESYQRSVYALGKTAMWATRHSDISVSVADEGSVVGNFLGMPSGSPTPIQFADVGGRWRIVAEDIGGSKNCKIISHRTSPGVMYMPTSLMQQNPTEAAFGTWEFWMRKTDDAAHTIFMPIAQAIAGYAGAAQNGYSLNIFPDEKLYLANITAGAFATRIRTPALSLNTWYKIRLTRTTSGIFSLYINDQLATAEAGTNPTAADLSFVTSTYMIWEGAGVTAGSSWAYACPSGNIGISHSPIA